VWIAGGAIILAGAIALAIATRGGADQHDGRARDEARSTEPTTTERTTRDRAAGLNAPAPAAATAGSDAVRASGIPLEAMPELAEAFRTAHFQDAVELCGVAGTFAAHQGDCTIAACRAHLEGRARGWFARVGDDDRDRVAKACEDAKITLGPRIRPHGRPHGRRGELD